MVLDFETTGVVGDHASEPWQIGLVRLTGGRVDPDSTWESLIRTGERPFNRHAPGRWHELRDDIRSAPALHELLPTLQERLFSVPIAAHNTATERTILAKYLPFHRPPCWLDTLHLARLAWPNLSSYALGDIIRAVGLSARAAELCPGRSEHDALYDAVASALLLETLLGASDWGSAPVESLSRLSGSHR